MKHQAPQMSDSKYLAFLIGAVIIISAMCLWVIFAEKHQLFDKWLVGLAGTFMIITLINSYFTSKEKINS
ncbi:MAG: hypothetical protein H7325_09705 [Pedobacter sp.]|nr:hypothetical protein [Pedobacter sp.]